MQKRVGGYNSHLPHTADLEMWLRLAAYQPVVMIDTVQAFKRVHSENMQNQFVSKMLPDILQRKNAFDSFFVKYGFLFNNSKELQQRYHKALAANAFWDAQKAFIHGNLDVVDELLDVVVQWDPTWPKRKEWRRLIVKRRIGYTAWHTIERFFSLFRS